jgi:hypothetical protein
MKKNNELEFESDKVKAYVQKLQAENGLLRQANEQLKAQIELIKISNQTTIDNLKRELIDQEAETLKAGGIIHKLEQTLTEIRDIAWVNPVNTCWEALNLCDKCEEKEDCEMQSPFMKLKLIIQKINEYEINNEVN